MNKNIITLCLIFSILILFSGGCESGTKKAEKKLQKEKSEKVLKNFMAKDHRERIALLSIKHNIEESTLESILDEYLTKHDLSYGLTKSLGKEEKWNIYDKF